MAPLEEVIAEMRGEATCATEAGCEIVCGFGYDRGWHFGGECFIE